MKSAKSVVSINTAKVFNITGKTSFSAVAFACSECNVSMRSAALSSVASESPEGLLGCTEAEARCPHQLKKPLRYFSVRLLVDRVHGQQAQAGYCPHYCPRSSVPIQRNQWHVASATRLPVDSREVAGI